MDRAWASSDKVSEQSTRRWLQPMLHGMIIACDNLPANSLGKMNHERRFQIQRQRAANITDNDQHLRVAGVFESQRRDLSFGYAHLIVGHKSSWTYDA